MCGIAGVMTKAGHAPDLAILNSMETALAHRGPDGSGRYAHGDTVILQTRLAIIDLETGDQPFVLQGNRGPKALVANGEIFNYRELYSALSGVKFSTASDCEVPLHLYNRDGTKYAEALRGMYAVAIHDATTKRLVLTRDPFGIKPLYYVETDTAFAFASEPQALIRSGLVTVEENADALHELFQLQFTCQRETVFSGIQRVLPGETVVVCAGHIVERIYRKALPLESPEIWESQDAMAHLDQVLMDSVDIHQRSDVPYGMFLSGGIDSSALLAMMARLNEKPVQAFTIGFDGAGVHDEREHARAVAAAAGAAHKEVSFRESDFWDLLPTVAKAVDDPTADYAVLPTYKLARAARNSGLKVVLSGEGGDEMFAGYGRYRRAARSRLLGGRNMRAAGQLEGLGVLRRAGRGWRQGIAALEADLPGDLSQLQRAQAIDCTHWLPNDLLTKLDRCLMAHGVEGRVPFVDPVLAAFAFRLPDALKVNKRFGKTLLRSWLVETLPASKPFTKKRGFTVPVGEWIAAKGRALGPLVAAQSGVARYCDPDTVNRLFQTTGKRESQAQWTLLFFALWHVHYVEGKFNDGGVFDALTA